jgi:MoaD family protein
MITLKLFASLRDAVGQKEVEIAKDSATLKEVLDYLSQTYGEKVKDYLFDSEGNIWQSVMLLVNDQPLDRDPAVALKDGDIVSILLPTAGG